MFWWNSLEVLSLQLSLIKLRQNKRATVKHGGGCMMGWSSVEPIVIVNLAVDHDLYQGSAAEQWPKRRFKACRKIWFILCSEKSFELEEKPNVSQLKHLSEHISFTVIKNKIYHHHIWSWNKKKNIK